MELLTRVISLVSKVSVIEKDKPVSRRKFHENPVNPVTEITDNRTSKSLSDGPSQQDIRQPDKKDQPQRKTLIQDGGPGQQEGRQRN